MKLAKRVHSTYLFTLVIGGLIIFLFAILSNNNEPVSSRQIQIAEYQKITNRLYREAKAQENVQLYALAAEMALQAANIPLATQISSDWIKQGGGLPALRLAAGIKLRYGQAAESYQLLQQITELAGSRETYRTIVLNSLENTGSIVITQLKIDAMVQSHLPENRDADYHAHMALLFHDSNQIKKAEESLAQITDETYLGKLWLETMFLFEQEEVTQFITNVKKVFGEQADLLHSVEILASWLQQHQRQAEPLPLSVEQLPDNTVVLSSKIRLRLSEIFEYLGDDQQALKQLVFINLEDRLAFAAYSGRLKLMRRTGMVAQMADEIMATTTVSPKLLPEFIQQGAKEYAKAAGAKPVFILLTGLSRVPKESIWFASLIAQYAYEAGLVEQATKTIFQLVERYSTNPRALLIASIFFVDRNYNLEQAEDYLTTVAEIMPDNPSVFEPRGWLAYRLNNYSEARQYLEKAADSALTSPEIFAKLGEVLWQSGDQKEALRVWTVAYRYTKGNELLNATIKKFDVERLIIDSIK